MSNWLRGLALLALALVAGCTDEPLAVEQGVELGRFQGSWYEIAKLPRPLQAMCTATTASYELRSNTELLVTHECREGDPSGPVHRVHARAVATDPDVPAKLSLDFGFAYGDYWIIELGDDYEYAVIGHPSRDYLWILARAPELEAELLSGITARARQRHFPVDLLDYTLQP